MLCQWTCQNAPVNMSKCGVCSLLLDVIVLSFPERLFFLFLVFCFFSEFFFPKYVCFFALGVTKAMFFQSSTPNNYHVTSPEKCGVGAFSWKKKEVPWNRAAWRTESFSVEPFPSTLGEVKGVRKQPGRSDSYGTPFCWCELWGVSKQKNPQHLGNAGVCFFGRGVWNG